MLVCSHKVEAQVAKLQGIIEQSDDYNLNLASLGSFSSWMLAVFYKMQGTRESAYQKFMFKMGNHKFRKSRR